MFTYSLVDEPKLAWEPAIPLREKILGILREAICCGELKGEEKIVEQELAQKLGVSRTPVREALLQLESEGYVKLIPRKGVVVMPLSLSEVKEYYDIKGLLEGYGAKLAAEKISESALLRLEWITQKLAIAAGLGDIEGYRELRGTFDNTFLHEGENLRLLEMIFHLEQKYNRLHASELMLGWRMQDGVKRCHSLLEAFRKRDGELAETIVKQAVSAVACRLQEQLS